MICSTLRRWFHKNSEAEAPAAIGPLYAAVRDALEEVRAYARSHGGDIELVGVSDEGDVRVRFRGACRGCPLADLTFKLGIEERLKELVPGIRSVIRA